MRQLESLYGCQIPAAFVPKGEAKNAPPYSFSSPKKPFGARWYEEKALATSKKTFGVRWSHHILLSTSKGDYLYKSPGSYRRSYSVCMTPAPMQYHGTKKAYTMHHHSLRRPAKANRHCGTLHNQNFLLYQSTIPTLAASVERT